MPPHATLAHEYTQHAAAPGLQQYRHAPAAPPPHVGQRERQQAQPPHQTASAMTGNSGSSSSSSAEQGIRVGNYIIREEIGKGSFATVYRGERMTTTPPTPVAIKAVTRNKLTTKLLENLDSEIRLLKGIKQRNVVELIECMKTSSHIYLVMAFCASGDLSQHIRAAASSKTPRPANEKYPPRKEGGLHEKVVRCFLGQLAEALKFLRDKDIIHRDIKPQNLLLHPASESDIAAGHPEGIPLLQVADFGFARALPSTSLAETLCGSPLYMAPEILQYQKYDAKADLWSVGAVLYECCTGRPPFRAGNHVELLRKIEKGEDKIRFPDEVRSEDGTYAVKDPISDDIKALIRGLLKQRPQERMPYEEFFRRTDEIARWSEGSLVAPGTIRQPSTSSSRVPSRQGSHRDVAKQQTVDRGSRLESRDSQGPPYQRTEQESGQAAPVTQAAQQRQRGTSGTASPNPRPGSVSPTVTTLAAAMALAPPSMPSTAAEQEPAFARLPPPVTPALPSARATPSPAPGYFTSAPGEPGLPHPAGATPGPSTPGPASGSAPPPLQQKKSFTPKYIVGGGSSADDKNQQRLNEVVEVRTKDFAVVTTAATPTHASSARRGSVPPSRDLSRRGSIVGEDVEQPATRSTMPPQQKSGISLALPRAPSSSGTTQSKAQQPDLGASGMTGDDDSVLGREYVVVEKRNVEVNALADEMAAQPQRPSTLSHRNSRGFLSRQLSTYPPTSPAAGASPSPPSPALPYPPAPHSGPAANAWEHPPFATRPAYGTSPRSRGLSSYMYGSSPGRYGALAAGSPAATATATAALAIVGSGGTAIAKALNMASLKLFGSPSENIWLRKIGHRRPIQRHSSGSGGGGTPLTVEEDNLLSDLEDIAQKATVIFDFADSKLVLMTSLMVSRGGADGAGTPAAVMQASYASPFFANAQQQARTARTSSFSSDRSAVSPLVPTSAASPVLSQQQVTSPAGTGKTDSVRKPELLPGETLVLYLKALAFLQKGIELARDYWSSKPAERPTSADLNEYVQWFRSRFNECFEKAEWAKGLLPGDVPDSAMLAERLVFDRALEMSRAAAVSELKNENSAECEIAYDTALWMLYAILDEVMQEGEPVGDEDKVHVQKFVNSIKGRLEALRRKMQTA